MNMNGNVKSECPAFAALIFVLQSVYIHHFGKVSLSRAAEKTALILGKHGNSFI